MSDFSKNEIYQSLSLLLQNQQPEYIIKLQNRIKELELNLLKQERKYEMMKMKMLIWDDLSGDVFDDEKLPDHCRICYQYNKEDLWICEHCDEILCVQCQDGDLNDCHYCLQPKSRCEDCFIRSKNGNLFCINCKYYSKTYDY
jgi:hypothetical protein